MLLPVIYEHTVLGSFSKGAEGSVSLNFCRSGGQNCDRSCPHHPGSKANDPTKRCYAVNTELRFDRKELRSKLNRHGKTEATVLVLKAIDELKRHIRLGHPIPWLRISTNGSVPQPEKATPDFRKALRKLLELCDTNHIPVHFPVETNHKAKYYRKAVGWRAVVRESAHSEQAFLNASGAVSCVAGTAEMTNPERLAEARRIAAARRESSGRKCIVCPAVASHIINRVNMANSPDPEVRKNARKAAASPNAKCGNCPACSLPEVDVVYPLH